MSKQKDTGPVKLDELSSKTMISAIPGLTKRVRYGASDTMYHLHQRADADKEHSTLSDEDYRNPRIQQAVVKKYYDAEKAAKRSKARADNAEAAIGRITRKLAQRNEDASEHLIDALASGRATGIESSFKSVMSQKVLSLIDSKKTNVVNAMFDENGNYQRESVSENTPEMTTEGCETPEDCYGMVGDPDGETHPMINHIVGKVHVGTPDHEVVNHVDKKLKGGLDSLSDEDRQKVIQWTLNAHAKNRDTYHQVMSGSMWSDRAKKNLNTGRN